MEKRLEGKVAAILGATSGLGRASAVLFAQHGAKVVAAGRREEEGNSLIEEIRGNGGEAVFVKTDAFVESDLKNFIDTAVQEYGKIDTLLATIGGGVMHPVHESTAKDYEYVFGVNYRAPLLAAKYAIPYMIEQKSGSIINTSSASTHVIFPGAVLYESSKEALHILTKFEAAEYAKYGIRANCIAPGMLETDQNKVLPNRYELAAALPMGRMGDPIEYAQAALFLASDEASYVSGRVLDVAGAAFMGA